MRAHRANDERSVALGTVGATIARDSEGVRRGRVGRLGFAANLATTAARVPIVVAGASDRRGTIDTSDDVISDPAQHGRTQRGVDVGAAGESAMSGRVPGGIFDQNVTTAGLAHGSSGLLTRVGRPPWCAARSR